MNVFVFGVGLLVVAILLVNVAPVFTDSINDVDADNPDLDNNAMSLLRLYPFLIVVGIIVLLVIFWWRGGLD